MAALKTEFLILRIGRLAGLSGDTIHQIEKDRREAKESTIQAIKARLG